MTEYTPEKVAELIAEARAEGADWRENIGAMPLFDRLADALTAVSAERDDARSDLNAETAAHADTLNLLAEALAKADRLHKAITEALVVRLDRNLPLHRAWPRYQDDVEHILRAALDKEGDAK